jgi:hypothetical protein
MAKWDYDGPILEIDKLSISFFTRLREIPAVMDFSSPCSPARPWASWASPAAASPPWRWA